MPRMKASFPGTGAPPHGCVLSFVGEHPPGHPPGGRFIRNSDYIDMQASHPFMRHTFAETIGLRVHNIDTTASGSVFELHDRSGGPRELSNRRHRSNHHSIGRIKHVLILLSKPLQQDRVVFVDYIIVENGTLRSSINFVLHPTFACKLKTWVHDALCPDPISQSFGRGLNSMPHYVMQVQDADKSPHD